MRAPVLHRASLCAFALGDRASARTMAEESLDIYQAIGNVYLIAASLDLLGLAAVAEAQGQMERAARLLGVADSMLRAAGTAFQRATE